MNEPIKHIEALLRKVAELHHAVYKATNGNDPNWAIWYAHWLIELSDFSKFLQSELSESELIYLLVKLNKEYTVSKKNSPWETYYANSLLKNRKHQRNKEL